MADFGKQMINDLPEQFKGKLRIEGLLNVIGRQFDKLAQFYDELNEKRNLYAAKGVQLDLIGSILGLDRKEAAAILREAGTELSDDLFRQVLLYKSKKNMNWCTYDDIMDAINILWDTQPIHYNEDPSRPARILLAFPNLDVDGQDPTVGRILALKPAGVALTYTVGYLVEMVVMGKVVEKAAFPRLILCTPFYFWHGIYLNGKHVLEGEWELRGIFYQMPTSMILGMKIPITESADARIIYSDDLWMLDGLYTLNGDRVLDAFRREEEL